MKTTSLLIACAPLLVLFSSPLAAQTTVSVPCNLDNTLYEDPTGSLSNGVGTSVFVGRPNGGLIRRALLRFDVSGSIPAGARILAASLSFNVVNSPVATPLSITGHFVTQGWGEGNSGGTSGGGGGAPSQPGDATWVHAFYPSTFWVTPGGDFIPTPSFTMSTPPAGVATAPPTAIATGEVQFWLDHPILNFGWLLKMVDETLTPSARRIDSRESTGIRPSLSVTYTVAGSAGVWGTGCAVGAGTLGFAFQGTVVGGSTMQLVQSNGPPGQFGANFLSLALDPVGTPLAPACSIYLLPTIITGTTFVLDGAGAASTPFVVPLGFPGNLLVSQSAALAGTPLGFALSNAAFLDLP